MKYKLTDLINLGVSQYINEGTKINFSGHTFILKVDVNEAPNKTGIKVHFIPTEMGQMSQTQQNDIAIELGKRLEDGLSEYDMRVERDRGLKNKQIIAFFIYIEYIDKIIRKALGSQNPDSSEEEEEKKQEEEPLEELDNSTVFSAGEEMRNKGQMRRKRDLLDTFFNKFKGKELLDSTILNIDADLVKYSEEERNLGLTIYLKDGRHIDYSADLTTGEDRFILPKSAKEAGILRKDARLLGLIAKKVNTETQYGQGTGDLKIRDYTQ